MRGDRSVGAEKRERGEVRRLDREWKVGVGEEREVDRAPRDGPLPRHCEMVGDLVEGERGRLRLKKCGEERARGKDSRGEGEPPADGGDRALAEAIVAEGDRAQDHPEEQHGGLEGDARGDETGEERDRSEERVADEEVVSEARRSRRRLREKAALKEGPERAADAEGCESGRRGERRGEREAGDGDARDDQIRVEEREEEDEERKRGESRRTSRDHGGSVT